MIGSMQRIVMRKQGDDCHSECHALIHVSKPVKMDLACRQSNSKYFLNIQNGINYHDTAFMIGHITSCHISSRYHTAPTKSLFKMNRNIVPLSHGLENGHQTLCVPLQRWYSLQSIYQPRGGILITQFCGWCCKL